MSPAEGLRRAHSGLENVTENVFTKLLARVAVIAMIPLAGIVYTQFMDGQKSFQETTNRQLANLQSQILDRTADRYTGSQHAADQAEFALQYARDWELQDRRDDRQEETHREDIVRIEGRIDTLAALAQRIMERFGG